MLIRIWTPALILSEAEGREGSAERCAPTLKAGRPPGASGRTCSV